MASSTPTASDLIRRPQLPSARGVRLAALVCGAALFEVGIGAAVASSHYQYAVMLAVGIAACWLIWRFPVAGCIAMLFFVGGIIYSSYYVFHFAGRTVYAHEVVLLVLLARAAIAPRRRTWGGAAGASLTAFLLFLIVSTLLALQSGSVSLNNAVNWSRAFYTLTFFWVVVRLLPDRRRLGIVVTAGIALGAISGVVGVVLAVAGNVNGVFQDSGHQALVPSMVGSLLRVRMPGLGLGYMLLWLALLWLARGRGPRLLWWICLPCMLLDILVSQNRNMWVLGVLSLVAVMVIAGPRTRGRLITALVVLVAGIAVLIQAPQSGPSPLQPVLSRASTLLNPSEISQSDSARDRKIEDHYAWADARHHLLIGIGPGVSYGLIVRVSHGNNQYATGPKLYVQVQWLYVLLVTGIPGTLSLLAFFVVTLRSAWIRGAPIESRVLGIGVLALMLTALVEISLTDEGFLSALALVAGAIFVLRPPVDRGRGGVPRATAR